MTTSILVVCTANRCRSPIAAAMLAREAHRRHLDLDIRSGGLLPGGQPVPPIGLRVAAERGLDLRHHRSHSITAADLATSDLVITMTRDHSRTLVARDPSLWPRVFTLPQLPSWLRTGLEQGRPPRRADLRTWIETVGAGRDRRELLGRGGDDEITDPFGATLPVWNTVVTQIDELCRSSLDLSVPLLRPLQPR